MSRRNRAPGPVRHQCSNCPARNRTVVLVKWRKKEMALCFECQQAIKRIEEDAAEKEAKIYEEQPEPEASHGEIKGSPGLSPDADPA